MPRGRPQRRPRTDPGEIERSAARWDEKVRAGLAESCARLAPGPPPTPDQLLRQAGAPMLPASVLDAACAAWARFAPDKKICELIGAIRDPGVRGVKARLRLCYEARAKFAAFVGTFPTPSAYRDMLLGFYVPIFNAANAEFRLCVECGTGFAVTNDDEIRRAKYCPPPTGAKRSECQRTAEKAAREKKRNERSIADVERELRETGERVLRHCCSTPGHCNPIENPCAAAKRAGANKLGKLRNELHRLARGKADAYRKLAGGYEPD